MRKERMNSCGIDNDKDQNKNTEHWNDNDNTVDIWVRVQSGR